LIKLRDYISRYELNPFHYPTQFIRLKRDNWNKLLQLWEDENEQQRTAEILAKQALEKSSSRFRWNLFAQKDNTEEQKDVFKRQLPKAKEQLRQYFLNRLFPFQLKWATSTLTQVSYTDQEHLYDAQLKFFLQHFPDIYLVMYYPIFNIKKAPVDAEIIMISPINIEIITILNETPGSGITVTDERTWVVEKSNSAKKIISPIISLKRTEQIVESILQKYELTFGITKTVLAQDVHFVYVTEPYKVNLVGKNEYDEWYKQKRQLSGSLKGVQLKVMEALARHCLTTSVRRPEWEQEDDEHLSFLIGE